MTDNDYENIKSLAAKVCKLLIQEDAQPEHAFCALAWVIGQSISHYSLETREALIRVVVRLIKQTALSAPDEERLQ